LVSLHEKYELQNIQQEASEVDIFTSKRYQQFFNFFPKLAKTVLDVGCANGRGGECLAQLDPSLILYGFDCVQQRLDVLPDCYSKGIYGLSNSIPLEDKFFDVIVAGEFIQSLYPNDVDATLAEFQRILKVGGRLLITTPNPHCIRNKIDGVSLYSHDAQLSKHFPNILRLRLLMHGFSKVKIYGSGKMSQFFGWYFPLKAVYGSYLIFADK
jgi:ubiquinone/menaquinone biosynthesis C-methylase UbiE